MSQKQINRYVVIQKSLEGTISVKEAATALNLSQGFLAKGALKPA